MTTVSEVSICNLALVQKLGANRITSLTDDSNNARTVNGCYATLRDKLLRSHPWIFAIKRAVLTPSSTAPAFTYTYAFPLPADCLRILIDPCGNPDWKRETQDGQQVILSNSATINLRYISRVTDPVQFDSAFVEALAADIAYNCCERITQSDGKKQAAAADKKDAMLMAKQTNALETMPAGAPEDSWLVARRSGNGDRNDLRWGDGW